MADIWEGLGGLGTAFNLHFGVHMVLFAHPHYATNQSLPSVIVSGTKKVGGCWFK